jgi:hypothetical protein
MWENVWFLNVKIFNFSGSYIEPESMALYSSRGYLTPSSKTFMRNTVLVTDVAIFFTAVVYMASIYFPKDIWTDKSKYLWFIVLVLLQPGIILIDHGHFQYLLFKRSLSDIILPVLALQYSQSLLYGQTATY